MPPKLSINSIQAPWEINGSVPVGDGNDMIAGVAVSKTCQLKATMENKLD